jgi:hypothetical protein
LSSFLLHLFFPLNLRNCAYSTTPTYIYHLLHTVSLSLTPWVTHTLSRTHLRTSSQLDHQLINIQRLPFPPTRARVHAHNTRARTRTHAHTHTTCARARTQGRRCRVHFSNWISWSHRSDDVDRGLVSHLHHQSFVDRLSSSLDDSWCERQESPAVVQGHLVCCHHHVRVDCAVQ